MEKKARSCSLVCLQRSHDPIPLPDGVAVSIGRSPQTRIVDPRCSRMQVELTANVSARKVIVRQLANNNTSIDGVDIGQSKKATLLATSTLFILSGQYPHQVVFEDNLDKTHSSVDDHNSKKDLSTKKDSALERSKTKEKKSLKRQHADRDGPSDCKKQKVDATGHGVDKTSTKDKEKVIVKNVHKSSSSDRISSSSNSHSSNSSPSIKSHLSKIKEKINDLDEDDEHMKSVKAKLKQMQQNAKPSDDSSSSLVSSSSSVSRSNWHTKNASPSSPKDKPDHDSSSSSKALKADSSSSSSKKSSAPTEESAWTSHEHLCVFTSKGVHNRNKVAGFDIDGTIIRTKSGKTFPKDSSDWMIAFPEIFGKLKECNRNGYKIVFFTNQLGVARGKVKIEDLKIKIENIISHLHIPVQVFIATNSGRYRKPMDGMWKRLKSQYNGTVPLDVSSSFYVGDAAGRPADWEPKKKKDFSCSDRLFALNVGLKFYTPEEYFLKRKPTKFNLPVFDPRALPSQGDWVEKGKLPSGTKEIVVLVGYPACGKSHFAKNALKSKGYVVVNRDTLGTWQKCVKMTQESIVNSSVVVDNTNLTKDERARYTKCAKQAGVPCRCFLFTTSIEHCRHNERFRELNDKSHAPINDMIFNKIKASYQEPKLEEGFSELLKVSFVPKFSSSSFEADYRKFLMEK